MNKQTDERTPTIIYIDYKKTKMEKVFYLPVSIFCISIRIGYLTATVNNYLIYANTQQ